MCNTLFHILRYTIEVSNTFYDNNFKKNQFIKNKNTYNYTIFFQLKHF